MRYIELRDLIGGAFTFLLEEEGSRTLSMAKIEAYGREILACLNKQNPDNRLKLSPERTQKFFQDNFDYFSYNEKNSLVILKEGITFDQLMGRYIEYLPLDAILALRDEEICRKYLL